MHPTISVIIPVYNGAEYLDRCLAFLGLSLEKPLECIVVDDGSTDGSARIAERHGARVLATEGRCGPARARNIGAASARGSILLFIDSDVTVHPDTLSKMAIEFAADPALDAVMGSYDDDPTAPNFMSQYRNLMHCFVHQRSNRQATTFWAGCGAIRREVFAEFNGFDEKYRSAAIEDIELGYRMSAAGRKLALNPSIQVTHMKRWSLRTMLRADFFHRALPWSELAIRSGRLPNDLNLRVSQRISVSMVFILCALAGFLTLRHGAFFLLPLFVTFFILLSYYWLEMSGRNNRLITALMVGALCVIGALSYQHHEKRAFVMVVVSWVALLIRRRISKPMTAWSRISGILTGGYCMTVILLYWYQMPRNPVGTAFLIGGVLLMALNQQFYFFLAGQKGRLFALAAIPFHLLYFISSGIAFLLTIARHRLGRLDGPVALPADEAKTDL